MTKSLINSAFRANRTLFFDNDNMYGSKEKRIVITHVDTPIETEACIKPTSFATKKQRQVQYRLTC